jgi:hypothetical protein
MATTNTHGDGLSIVLPLFRSEHHVIGSVPVAVIVEAAGFLEHARQFDAAVFPFFAMAED